MELSKEEFAKLSKDEKLEYCRKKVDKDAGELIKRAVQIVANNTSLDYVDAANSRLIITVYQHLLATEDVLATRIR
ncbi:MAG: hypothetical protein HY226_04005 [Candidatus Vogelbacteria bacterium]|nr:hypothetical protein [Candidatus Vogelbacteria bacterium]